jgi:hypothetical protein
MKRLTSLSVLLSLVVALPLCAAPAYAEEAIDLDAVEDPPPKGGPGVMVRPFEGPRAKTIRDRLVRALTKANVNLVPADKAKKKLGGAPAPYVEVAKASGVEAFVHGKVSMNKKNWTLTLEVRSGATGAVAGTEEITSGWLPGLLKAIDKDAKAKIDTLVEAAKSGGSVAPSTATEGEAKVDSAALVASNAGMDPVSDSEPEASETSVDATRPPPFVVYVGGGGLMRSFSYSDPLLDTKRQGLLPHSATLLNVQVGAMWYPAAHFGDGVLSHFGLNGRFTRSLGGKTSISPEQLPDGAPQEYPTIFQELDVGLRARVPMGSWEMGLNFGLGSQQMGLAGDNVVVRLPYATADEPYPGVVPDIDSTYYRFGGDIVFPWLDSTWTIGAGMRLPNFSEKPGALRHERWFPNANASGATAALGVNIPVYDFHGPIGLLVLAEFRRTQIDMNSSTSSIVVNSETDPSQNQLTSSIAGGAADQYLMLTLGVTWGLGGSAGTGSVSSSTEAEEEVEVEEADEADEPEEAEAEEAPAPAAKPAPAAPPPPKQKDTSDPSFFGEASGSAKTPAPAPAPAKAGGQSDTSNPDFFK